MKSCVIIGVSNRIEIWDEARWQAFTTEAEENFDEIAETMIDFGFIGRGKRMAEFQHYTVMLKETVDGLAIRPDGIYVDCTLGGAGHSEYLLSQLSEEGHLYAFDQDQKRSIMRKERLASYVAKGMVTFIKSNFRYLKEALQQQGVDQVERCVV